MRSRTILITNYHPSATAALIRDFNKIGFRVVSPDNDWGKISYFASNVGLGSELISYDDYRTLEPGWVLLTCKPQEANLLSIAQEHNDLTILNIAQQGLSYTGSLSEIMICPDIVTYENHKNLAKENLLYFPRPFIKILPEKNIENSFKDKTARSFVSKPSYWPDGTKALQGFTACYPYETESFGIEAPHGHLTADECIARMAESFVTLSFKESEAYGLSCLESMLAGTPVASLNWFMTGKTLGTYFIDNTTGILAETVEGLVERLTNLSIDEYKFLSKNAQDRVLDLTSDKKTVERLRAAIDKVLVGN